MEEEQTTFDSQLMRILEEMIEAEADILERVSGLPIDVVAMSVASNIWRTSQLFRQKMERDVLLNYQLSWASFSSLFIVWIWGPIDMGAIAESQSVGRSTITSSITLLEKKGYCVREHQGDDRRSVYVRLTPAGQALIEEVFPIFNRHEKEFTACLTDDEAQTLTHLLRKVILHQRTNPLQEN